MDSQTIIILGGIAVLGIIALGVIHNRLTVKAKKGDVEVSIECSSPPPPPTAPQKSPPSIDNQTNIGGDQLNAAHDMFHVKGNLILADAKLPALNLNQIGEPVGDFIGREIEIGRLVAAFDARGENRGAVISGVRGMAGVGKTELAKMAAKRLKKQFPDGQIFFNLRGARDDDAVQPATPAEALQYVIQTFRPDVKLPDAAGQLQGLYHSVLDGKRVLLLMDNALDACQLAPLAPPPDGCALIVTSRNHISLPGLNKVDLDTMPPQEARDLLLKICPRINGHADGLAERCGYLPLALRLSASALDRNPALSVEDYLARLEKEQDRLALLDEDSKMVVGVDRGVEASLAASYSLLEKRLQPLWRALAVFPADFDAAGAVAVWQLKENDGAAALGHLYTASMVLWDEATRRYRLHDLARDYANAQLPDQEGMECAKRHAEHYLTVLRSTDYLYLEGGNSTLKALALFDMEWRNIQQGQAWASATSEEDDVSAKLSSDYAGTGVHCLNLRVHGRGRVDWLEQAIKADSKISDGKVQPVHLSNLGLAYSHLGETRKARDLFEKVLALYREDGNKRSEAGALANLGGVHYVLGDIQQAIKSYEEALALFREDRNSHGESGALTNLALAYVGLGETRTAIDLLQQSLSIARGNGDRLSEGACLDNLGIAYRNLGLTEHAIGCYEARICIAREMKDERGEASALNNMGNACASLDQKQKAIEHHERALFLYRQIGDPRGEAVSLHNLAGAVAAVGQRDKAVAYAALAVKILERLESPYLGTARARLEEISRQK